MSWRDVLFKPPRHVKAGLSIAALVWGWLGFKEVESTLYPVVSDFVIESVRQTPEHTEIAGTLIKHRDCQFKEVIALNAANNVVSVQFTETAYSTTGVVSRPVGAYTWGWWFLIPRVSYLELYARHQCDTGEVLTLMFKGDVDAVSQ